MSGTPGHRGCEGDRWCPFATPRDTGYWHANGTLDLGGVLVVMVARPAGVAWVSAPGRQVPGRLAVAAAYRARVAVGGISSVGQPSRCTAEEIPPGD
jgi:hypothetical protein